MKRKYYKQIYSNGSIKNVGRIYIRGITYSDTGEPIGYTNRMTPMSFGYYRTCKINYDIFEYKPIKELLQLTESTDLNNIKLFNVEQPKSMCCICNNKCGNPEFLRKGSKKTKSRNKIKGTMKNRSKYQYDYF